MAKLDLDAVEEKARRTGDNPYWVSENAVVLALVARIRELEDAVKSALKETDNHNREYRYVTPAELIQSWRDLLEKGAVLP